MWINVPIVKRTMYREALHLFNQKVKRAKLLVNSFIIFNFKMHEKDESKSLQFKLKVL